MDIPLALSLTQGEAGLPGQDGEPGFEGAPVSYLVLSNTLYSVATASSLSLSLSPPIGPYWPSRTSWISGTKRRKG